MLAWRTDESAMQAGYERNDTYKGSYKDKCIVWVLGVI